MAHFEDQDYYIKVLKEALKEGNPEKTHTIFKRRSQKSKTKIFANSWKKWILKEELALMSYFIEAGQPLPVEVIQVCLEYRKPDMLRYCLKKGASFFINEPLNPFLLGTLYDKSPFGFLLRQQMKEPAENDWLIDLFQDPALLDVLQEFQNKIRLYQEILIKRDSVSIFEKLGHFGIWLEKQHLDEVLLKGNTHLNLVQKRL